MKNRRLNLIAGIIVSGLILQGWFGGQASGVQAPASKTAAEANAVNPQAEAEPNGPPPKLVFEQDTHDFGSVAPGSVNICKFKFANKGEGVLKISEVTKTCGCTVFTLDKKEYAAGEQGVIDASYNADKGSGVRTRHLYVLSNDPVNPRIDLTIKATITQKISYEPDKLEYTLKSGAADLTLRSVDDQNFAIISFGSTGDSVSADFDPNKKATKFILKTRMEPNKMAINNSGQIEINTTHPECPMVTVPFSVLQRFKVEPPAINILNAEPGKAIERELWLLNNYNEDFEVVSATSKEGIIKVTSKEKVAGQEKVGTRYKFNLSVLPPTTENPGKMFTDTLTITTKDGEKIEVTCRGFYQRK